MPIQYQAAHIRIGVKRKAKEDGTDGWDLKGPTQQRRRCQGQYSSRYTEIAPVIRIMMLLTPPLSCPRHPPPLSTFTPHLRCTVGSYRGASGQNMTGSL